MKRKKLLFCCLIGTVLEWYDFALFGALSPFLSTIFFPHKTQSVALILTLAIFATGFVMRPLGAIFFGHIGDKYGRKKAVILSMMTMTTATVLMGLLPILPSHALATVIMLVTLRILQGFSVSGESAGVETFLSESLKNNKRFFFYMSLIGSATLGGILLGSVIGGIAFSLQQQYSFSWRIPFLLSVLLGAAGLYLRLRVMETPTFQKMKSQKILVKIPLLTTIIENKKKIALAVAIGVPTSIFTYFIILAYPLYTKGIYGKLEFFKIQTTILLVSTILPPFLALLVTQKNIIAFTARSLLLIAVAIVPLTWLSERNQTMPSLLLIGILYALCYVPIRSIISTILCLLFPHPVRYTSTALVGNLSVLIGGIFPLISTTLQHKTGSFIISGSVIALFAFLASIALFVTKYRITVT